MTRSSRWTLGAWGLLAVAAVVLLTLRLRGRPEALLTNDGVQYLAVTRVLRETGEAATDIVYFDAERRLGRIPAPSVTFPTGLPRVLAAVVDATGLRPERAALVVNLLSLLGVLAVLSVAAARVGVAPRWGLAALALWPCNAQVLHLCAHALTEPLFTLLVTTGVALVTLPTHRASLAAALGGALVGLSHSVRYAGLLVAIALLVTCVVVALRGHRERARRWGLAALVAAPIVAAGLLRNVRLVGDWRGGNDKVVRHGVLQRALDTLRSADALVLGRRDGGLNDALHGVFWALAAYALVTTWRARVRDVGRDTNDDARRKLARHVAGELACVAAVYAAGIVYVGLRTVVSYGPRMFAPMVPWVVVVGMAALASDIAPRGRRAWSWVVLAVLSVTLNLRAITSPSPASTLQRVAHSLGVRDAQGRTAYEALRALRRDGEPILATEGQAVGHLVHAPTLALGSPEYSVQSWDEAAVRALALRSGAGVLVLVQPTEARARGTDAVPSEFVARLLRDDEAPPPGFVRCFVSGGARIYTVFAGARR